MRVIITHSNADLDALASLVAAQRLYGDAVIVGSTSLAPAVQRFLALHKDRYPFVLPTQVDPAAVDEVVVVDVRDARRIAEVSVVLSGAHSPRVVVWDHHPASDHDLDAEEIHVEPVGACATLLVEALQAADVPIDAQDATLFLLGIYSDTGRLSYSTTRQRDVEAAAWLLSRGASLKVVNRYLRSSLTAEQSALLVELLESCEEFSVELVEVGFASAVRDKSIRGVAMVVQRVMELSGDDAVFAVIEFQRSNRVQVVGRSRVSYVDVGAITRRLGGGGHAGAGAATVRDGNVSSVIELLKELLREKPLEPVRAGEIMSAPVVYLAHDMPLRAAEEFLAEHGISGAPVRRDGELAGVLSRRDVARARAADRLGLPVSSHMSSKLRLVDEKEPIEDVLEMMTEADIGRMPVTRDGEVVGILTRTDLLRRLYMTMWEDEE